jgi:hypothetical protein
MSTVNAETRTLQAHVMGVCRQVAQAGPIALITIGTLLSFGWAFLLVWFFLVLLGYAI